MIHLYFHSAPNPMKVALFLEEAGLPYKLMPIDTFKGEQHTPAYRQINPNGKTPAIVDGDVTVFDSNAILLYLAEKSGKFLSEGTPAARGQMLSWLMFVASGIGPYSGQAAHFKLFAPEPKEYAVNRYVFEAERHWGILNDQLTKHPYVLGSKYTLVDMAVWGWSRAVGHFMGTEVWEKIPHVKRHLDEISARPAAMRAEELRDQVKFKMDFDEEARMQLFPGNVRLEK